MHLLLFAIRDNGRVEDEFHVLLLGLPWCRAANPHLQVNPL